MLISGILIGGLRLEKELRSDRLMNIRLINSEHSERVDYFPDYSSQGF